MKEAIMKEEVEGEVSFKPKLSKGTMKILKKSGADRLLDLFCLAKSLAP